MLPGYDILAELARSERYTLYRGRRKRNAARVLLKVASHDLPRTPEYIKQEFQLLRSMNVAGVARAQEVVHGSRHSALVLEDAEGTALSALAKPDLWATLQIGIGVARTLAALHQRRIVCNTIHPAGILFDTQQGSVLLTDLAAASEDSAAPFVAPLRPRLPSMPAYCSPEQTGRMNRSCDYRTDLYSLGVVLYELLTGRPPFQSVDPLELIHSHLARMPRQPAHVDPAIPAPVSDIVMKLLEKMPEDRYQSAAGLRVDLETCATHWNASRKIPAFVIAQHDISERFTVPERLYGREPDLRILLDAFDRCCQGKTSLLLVAGYSGIGKTSFIQALYKPIVRQRGYFVTGKCDQVVRNIPFGALVQAFHSLIQQLLTENEERLALWRFRLLEALGSNGGVLTQVLPEIELIIGQQPLPPALGSTESLNRFQLVFQNFIATLARQEHPLVVFLDDLQWADTATLSLFQPLLSSPDIRYFFLMGAYRDNEVDEGHHLMRATSALVSAGIPIYRVALGPLQLGDLTQLIRDTLHGETADAESLARLVVDKTGGNPFFAIQFLQALNREGFIAFDSDHRRWTYDLEAIRSAPLTDNVVDLMARKIQRLSPRTQRALTLAACIGNRFEADTLALVSQQNPEAAAEDLEEAVAEGLVLPFARLENDGGTHTADSAGPERSAYTFLHDRVQQAAYTLVSEERRDLLHLAVGRLLRSRAGAAPTDAMLFDIVHHLNLASRLIDNEAERLELAQQNLSAGQRAKTSTAYEAALGYFEAGLGLLKEEYWRSFYDLAFALHFEAAECLYFCGRFEQADQRFGLLLQRARNTLEKARVYRLRSVQHENMARYSEALAIARDALQLFDIAFPESAEAKQIALDNEIESIESLLRQRPIESLIDLPVMTDPEVRMVMNILTDIWSPAYIIGDAVLARLISATMVRLSLLHGNSEESAYGYVTHAITIGPVRGDYKSAYEFGSLALHVNERFNDFRRRAKIHQQFHAHVNFWRRPMRSCIPHAQEACRSGLQNGDYLYAAYGAATESWPEMVSTQDLSRFVEQFRPNLALIRKLKIVTFADSLNMIVHWAKTLKGETDGPLSMTDEEFDEKTYVETYGDSPFFTMMHAVARLQLCYLFGEYRKALETARAVGGIAHELIGMIWTVSFDFWNGLTLAANWADATDDERRIYLDEMDRMRKTFKVLAENCPENFLCQSLLLSAEIERIAGQEPAALDFYERAVHYAGKTGMLQHRALADELYARFLLQRGESEAATVFMVEARACYARWGAAAKVEELERRYADLLGMAPKGLPSNAQASVAAPTAESEAAAFDLVSVIKAAQAIAGEIELEKLLAKLIQIALENVGADRGQLVLEQDGEAFVYATGSLDVDAVKAHVPIPIALASGIPASVVNYVRRTLESVVLADPQHDDQFGSDPYIARHAPRSLMCVPVLYQGRMTGTIYLENTFVSAAFTPERIRIMQMLAAQAAIALENTSLISGLQAEIGDRRQAQERLSLALAEVEVLKKEVEAENVYLRRDMIANLSHDLRTPLASMRGYLETVLMKEDSLTAERRHAYLDIAMRQCNRLATLVSELFELSKLQIKDVEVHPEPVQLCDLAQDVVKKFELVAEQKTVALKTLLSSGMPWAMADVGLIERVLENLIRNALEHTSNGDEVRVAVLPGDERVTVRVSDTGSGIPEADLPHIFERTYQGRKGRQPGPGGAGLGLAISKRILDLHNSQISVESTPGAGTSFSFSLPVYGLPLGGHPWSSAGSQGG